MRRIAALLLAAALFFVATGAERIAPAQRGSLSLADREAAVELTQRFEHDGEPVTDALLPSDTVELVIQFSWTGDLETIAEVKLTPGAMAGGALSEEAAALVTAMPTPRRAADAAASGTSAGDTGAAEDGAGDVIGSDAGADGDEAGDGAPRSETARYMISWRLPIAAPLAEGTLRASAPSIEYLFEGFDRHLAVDGRATSIEVRAPAFQWVWPLVRWLGMLVGVVILGVLAWMIWRMLRRVRQSMTGVFFSSEDPTPWERIHAELASCEMKAQIEDFDGFFRKFHPLIYRFAAATEGPGVTTFTTDELAKHFDQVGYDAKVAARLIDFLRVCDRFDKTGEEPTAEQCLTMTRMVRQLASQCVIKSPRAVAQLHELD